MITNHHKSWQDFIEQSIDILNKIEKQIQYSNYTPEKENVLRFLNTDLNTVKIVVLGQDPYPQPGVAVGRAFEVGNIKNWSQPFPQASLKNILRAIYGAVTGESPYLPFSFIRERINDKSFLILPPDRLFKSWSDQGVLLLNTALTCEIGSPGSHSEIWRPFTDMLIKFLDAKRPDCRWFLWGGHALAKRPLIENGKIYASRHPMLCSEKWEDDFLKNPCFKDTMEEIDWTGMNGGGF